MLRIKKSSAEQFIAALRFSLSRKQKPERGMTDRRAPISSVSDSITGYQDPSDLSFSSSSAISRFSRSRSAPVEKMSDAAAA